MHGQLMGSYASCPETGGFGIYLVFWFGPELTMLPPEGDRPESAEELKERLQDLLTIDQARKVSVCVIDVSPRLIVQVAHCYTGYGNIKGKMEAVDTCVPELQ